MKTIYYFMLMLMFILFSFPGIEVSQHIYAGADLHVTSHKPDKRALHKAVSKGQVEAVRQLLIKGADVHARNGRKQTALHLAAKKGFPEIVALLLAAGAEVDARDKTKRTPLHYAGVKDHVEVARHLLVAGADIEAVEPKHEGTVLHLAVEEGHVEMVKLLLRSGAVLNASCAVGWTALHAAVAHGQVAVARVLLGEGAYTFAKDVFGKSPLDYAEEKDHKEMIALLTESRKDRISFTYRYYYGEEPVPILDHAESGNIEEVKRLLSDGADVNARYKGGLTLLIAAAGSGNEELVRFLLQKGADVRARTDRATYPIRTDKAISYDVSREMKEWYSYSALEVAVARGVTGVVARLVEAGAPVNPTEKFAAIPLHMAIPFLPHYDRANTLKMVNYLLEQGADVNRAEDVQRWTALHAIAQSGDKEVAALLVKAGGDLEAREVNAFTPAIMAAFHRSYDVFDFYARAGADLTARNEFGQSPIDVARKDPFCPLDFDSYK